MIKASATALIIATLPLFATFNPADHELVSESPTESSQMIPPADDIAPIAPPPKPVKPVKPYTPPVAKAEVKTVKAVVATETKQKQTEKPIYKRQKETKQRTINVEATAYTAKCKGCSGITKRGDNVRKTIYVDGRRVIAVDPKVIPLGSIVRVSLADGQSFEAIASDIGGAVKNKQIDVLVASYDDAIRLGRQKATVTIIKLGG